MNMLKNQKVKKRNRQATRLISRHPFASFTILSYLFSWTFWAIALLLPQSAIATPFYYIAGFGPFVAAMMLVKLQGRSLKGWVTGLFKWRLHPGWYLFAFGFPIFLIGLVSVIYVLLGNSLDFTLLPARLAPYLPMLLMLFLIGGGNEEPGWRGFGLPALQRQHSPVVATCILGIVWAFWHLPLLAANPGVTSGAIGLQQILLVAGVTLVSITTHAFWYTWLMNKTGSVLLCSILHASYNAANGLLLLIPDEALRGGEYQLVLALMTTVLMASVAGLVIATKGRLGLQTSKPNSR
ncbi:CAAX amino terminal protease family [Synechococcus sp. PCC 7335]|uniref:CPBP family intramembrane glutamic endopeptidase n=1 Tax=Synechococcus sp. (strain ATCC 29403 / PCC 7335) TaxID=91464 RepID=UPI00017EDD5B|nr:type II CAAX endopeptidase family protein [Synechococcus sp. PCC 7335]EDX83388.1 CAAX amino terminal protease family [Synechococcus sp. PCC 7335]